MKVTIETTACLWRSSTLITYLHPLLETVMVLQVGLKCWRVVLSGPTICPVLIVVSVAGQPMSTAAATAMISCAIISGQVCDTYAFLGSFIHACLDSCTVLMRLCMFRLPAPCLLLAGRFVSSSWELWQARRWWPETVWCQAAGAGPL